MKFSTVLHQEPGRPVTGIVVPPEVVDALGSGKRPAVRVTIDGGYTYRNTVAVMGGRYMLSVSAQVRAVAGIKGGDPIEVDLELDTEKREAGVPDDLAAAIDSAPEARRYFDTLSNSKKLLLVNRMNVKNVELRRQRIESTVAQLLTGKV